MICPLQLPTYAASAVGSVQPGQRSYKWVQVTKVNGPHGAGGPVESPHRPAISVKAEVAWPLGFLLALVFRNCQRTHTTQARLQYGTELCTRVPACDD